MRGLRLPSDAQDPPAASSSSSTGSLRCEKIVFDRRNPLDLRRDRYPRNLKDIFRFLTFSKSALCPGKKGGERRQRREKTTPRSRTRGKRDFHSGYRVDNRLSPVKILRARPRLSRTRLPSSPRIWDEKRIHVSVRL